MFQISLYNEGVELEHLNSPQLALQAYNRALSIQYAVEASGEDSNLEPTLSKSIKELQGKLRL